jgi:peptidoglycan/xylan/chitin deacetylase (PgdA/CDA1 family)
MRQLARDIYLRIFGNLRKPAPGIHLINSHYISPNAFQEADRDTMRYFMEHLASFANFLTLEEAVRRIENRDFGEQVLLSFTFDDGYAECYHSIAPILEEFDTRGAFFINANYPESSESFREGYHKRVAVHTKTPMNWEEIIALHQRGHLIGSHTLDHENLSELSAADIHKQLAENKQILEQKLNYSCEHFAWTYGGTQHFNELALEITQQYHKYIYSGTDFKNYYGRGGKVLNRRHLEPNWPKSHINYFLSHSRS